MYLNTAQRAYEHYLAERLHDITYQGRQLTSLHADTLAKHIVQYHKCQAYHDGDIQCNERGYPMILHVSRTVSILAWLCQDCAEQVHIDTERERYE